MQNFKKYVLTRRGWHSEHPNFVRDVDRDKEFPDPQCWEELFDYLNSREADAEAMRSAWFFWERFVSPRRAAGKGGLPPAPQRRGRPVKRAAPSAKPLPRQRD